MMPGLAKRDCARAVQTVLNLRPHPSFQRRATENRDMVTTVTDIE